MEGYYDHADRSAWSDARLQSRWHDLEATSNVPHSPERLDHIHHEMACIAFEGIMRQQEKRKREEEISWLEHEAKLDDCETEPFLMIELDDGEA